ncbi:MAG: hypothetical protein ABSF62_20965 [Bryobacteraceae bacterium]
MSRLITLKTKTAILTPVLITAMILLGSMSGYAATPPTYAAGHYGYSWYVASNDGSYQPYGIYVPTGYNSSVPAGLVFYSMHGSHGHCTDSFASVATSWANANNALLVSLEDRYSQNFDGTGEVELFDVLAALKASYSVDPTRLYAEGSSMGGHPNYLWPFRFPGLFAANAPDAGWTSFQDFYFKWYAGLSEDVGHWGNASEAPNLNNPAPAPGSSQDNAMDADASRRPLLENASAWYHAENGEYQPIFISYTTGDPTNQEGNALWIIAALEGFGYNTATVHSVVSNSHGASYNQSLIYPFFTGKTATVNPTSVVYNTNFLKYNTAYWLTIDRLQYTNQWTRLAANISAPNTINVTAANLVQYTLALNSNLVNMSQPVEVYTNGALTYSGPASSSLTFYAALSPANTITGWSTTNSLPGTLVKNHTIEGPINHYLMSSFVLVYGTAGTAAQTAQNQADAQQFVTEWNDYEEGFYNSHDSGAGSAWNLPSQNWLTAIPDTAVTPAMIASSNLRLFGDHNTNSITAQIKGALPLTLLDNGVSVGGRAYTGDNVRYAMIYPNPLNPNKYVVVGRGYLTEYDIDSKADTNDERWGCNLERLPWDQPDYTVWTYTPRTELATDPYPGTTAEPPLTVQSPDSTRFRHTPATYLEAGYFDQNWQLDSTPPVTTLSAQPTAQGVQITLSAADNLGGFGVSGTNYRVDGGAWTVYTAPFTLNSYLHTVQYYSTDAASRDTSPQGVVPNNVEAVNSTSLVTITKGGFVYNFTTGRFNQQIQLTNLTQNAVPGPISLVLDNLSSNATLFNASGVTSVQLPAGSPYANTSGLAAGASETFTIQFTDPTKTLITYTPRVLAGSVPR